MTTVYYKSTTITTTKTITTTAVHHPKLHRCAISSRLSNITLVILVGVSRFCHSLHGWIFRFNHYKVAAGAGHNSPRPLF